MTPILKVRSAYLTPDGFCKISYEEAHLGRNWLRDEYFKSQPNSNRKALAGLALRDYHQIVLAYQHGHLKESPGASFQRALPFNSLADMLNEPDKAVTPPLPDALKQATASASPPSEMDFDALSSENRIGIIFPPLPDAFFPIDNFAVPVRNGFYHPKLSLETRSLTNPIELQKGSRWIHYPAVSSEAPRVVPVPLGHSLAGLENDAEKIGFFLPTGQDPFLVRTHHTGPITFTVNDAEGFNPVIDPALRPTEEEQLYNRSLFRLPDAFKKLMLSVRTPEDKANLLVSWLCTLDPKTKRTNFQYVCHPELGRFIRNNTAHLPLIMNTLKAGHCDLLTWYGALLLRAYGVAAWQATVLTSTQDGGAMNGAYAHSMIAMEKNNGACGFLDLTRYVSVDPAYHRAVLLDGVVGDMASRFEAAPSDELRETILREFKEHVDSVRDASLRNSEVIQDFDEKFGGLPSLRQARGSDLGKIRVEIAVSPVSWELPIEVTPETLNSTVEWFDTRAGSQLFYLVVEPVYSPDKILKRDPITRMRLAWLTKAFKEIGFSGLYTYGSNFGTEGVKTMLKDHFDRRPRKHYFHDMPASQRSLFSSSSDFLRFMRYGCGYDPFHYVSGDVIEEHVKFNLASFLKGDQEPSLLMTHEYGELFKSCFTELPLEGRVNHLLWKKCMALRKENYETQIAQGRDDLLVFSIEFQLAGLNAEHRTRFLKKLNLSGATLRQIALRELGLEDRAPRRIFAGPEYIKGTGRNDFMVEAALERFHLAADCKARFYHHLAEVVRQLKFTLAQTVSFEDSRRYVPGDDLRNVDWNASARLDTLITKQAPVSGKNDLNVLHVLFEKPRNVAAILQHVEILEGLKKLSRHLGLTVYAGGEFGNAYFKLTQNSKTKEILKRLYAGDEHDQPRSGPWLPNRRFPDNFLYVSADGMKQSAVMHLARGECKNLKTVYLFEAPFTVFPLLNERYVREGLSKAGLEEINRQ